MVTSISTVKTLESIEAIPGENEVLGWPMKLNRGSSIQLGSCCQAVQMTNKATKKKSTVCLSVYGRNLSDLRSKLRLAHGFHPEFLEIRLDYLKQLNNSDLLEVKKLLRGNEILTIRSPSEGGVNSFNENTRISLLTELISEIEPSFLDIEMSTLRAHPELLVNLESRKSLLIASFHDFERTPSESKLKRIIQSSPKTRALYAVKIVCKAQRFQDNFRLLSLYDYARKLSLRLIAFCMGEYGLYSRVACVDRGSPFTYVSLPKEITAPGQLNIEVMKTLLEASRL